MALALAAGKIRQAGERSEPDSRPEPDSDALANTVIGVELLRYPPLADKAAVAELDQRAPDRPCLRE